MARFALMADKWLASLGPEEPFVVRNCKYAISIMEERSMREICMNTVKAMKSLNILS